MLGMRAPLSGTKRKDGRWQITVTLTEPSGAKRKVTIYAATQREVQAKAQELIYDKKRAAPVKRTVSELLDYCESGPWASLGARTLEQRQWARPRIEKKFGDRLVASIQLHEIYQWVVFDLGANPELSGRSVQIHRATLRVAFEQAKFLGWIKDNPAAGWRMPIDATPAPTPRLEPQDILNAIETAENRRYKLFLWTLWETGARPEEVTLLNSSHISKGENWWLFLPGTKTDNAARIVPVTAELVNELMELPEPWFPYNRRQWTHIWHKAQERLGWRPKRTRKKRGKPDAKLPTLYAIRKARITEWGDMGLSEEVWAALAGHEDADLTRKVYDKPTLRRIAKQFGLSETAISRVGLSKQSVTSAEEDGAGA